MTQATYVKAAEATDTNSTAVTNQLISNTLRLQDDFYSVVNRQWLNTAKIDAGQVENSTFMENEKLAQFDEFHETYGIKGNDKMYIKPEDRIKICILI